VCKKKGFTCKEEDLRRGLWKERALIRLLAKLILQEGKAPRVRGRSAEESPVLT